MKALKWLVLAAATFTTAACTPSGTRIDGGSLDGTYTTGGVRWASGPIIYILVKTFETQGKVGVCGAWYVRSDNAVVSKFHDDVMAAGMVYVDDTLIYQGLGFMQEHRGEEDLRGKASNCVRTSVDWQPSFENIEPSIDFPRMRFNV
ncbi:MAG: hypothetical protein AAF674_20835 [Pseudomonadota bacterium]